MQHKALYRKYRPIDFEDVVGQSPIIKTLVNSIKENKIGHAYLFTGTRGTGKTTVAKIFARTVNCESLKDGISCGTCKICEIKTIDENPDIIEIDAASNNGVDEIREIKNKATLVPVMSKYKVYIIDEVHMLSIGAFNALLKTLEEPPSHSIFILATTEPQKIPITIISRCQRFDFKKIALNEIQNRLKTIANKEEIIIDDVCLAEISKIADGSLRDAIGLLDQSNSFSNGKITIESIYELTGNLEKSKIFELIEKLFKNDIGCLIEMSEDLYDSGKNFERITETIIDILMNLLIYKNAKKYFEKKNVYYKEDLKNIDKLVTKEKLNETINEFNNLLEKMRKSSNPNIVFELSLFKLVDTIEEETITHQKQIDEIVIEKDKENETEIKNEIIEEVKNEKKQEKILEKDKINIEYSYKLKEALINNTIALANKEYKKEIKEAFKKLGEYLANSKNKTSVTLLMDCNINAASENRLLLTYKYDSLVYEHDKNINKIEKIISELTNRKYKVVAISEEKWNELRPRYIELKEKNKKIELIEEIEEETMSCKIENKNDGLNNTIEDFGFDIIELEE